MTKKTKLITLGHIAILLILLFSTTARGEVKGIDILKIHHDCTADFKK